MPIRDTVRLVFLRVVVSIAKPCQVARSKRFVRIKPATYRIRYFPDARNLGASPNFNRTFELLSHACISGWPISAIRTTAPPEPLISQAIGCPNGGSRRRCD